MSLNERSSINKVMKAHEFINEEIIDEWSKTHPGIKKELMKKGYKLLGAGADQMAFLEPGTGYVLKIFGTQNHLYGKPDSFSADQKMFITFAKFCMKNQDNPFLPKFFGYESFAYEGNNYLQIRQERLKKSGDLGYTIEAIGDYLNEDGGLSVSHLMQNSMEAIRRGLHDDTTDNDGHTRDDADFPEVVECIELLGEKPTELLISTISQLLEICDKKEWGWDLHDENVMLRGKTPVLVDPWVAG